LSVAVRFERLPGAFLFPELPLAAQQTQPTKEAETGEKPASAGSKHAQIDFALGQDFPIVKLWLPPTRDRAKIFEFNPTIPALSCSI
jgi:hypothetical protein